MKTNRKGWQRKLWMTAVSIFILLGFSIYGLLVESMDLQVIVAITGLFAAIVSANLLLCVSAIGERLFPRDEANE